MNDNMEWNWNYDIVGIVSKSQSGKTTLIKKLIKNAGISKEDIYIFDTNFEYKEYKNNTYTINYNKSALNEFVMKIRKQKDKLVIFEDIDLFQPAYAKAFHDLLVNGKHQYIGIIYTTRRVRYLNPLTLSMTDFLIFSKFIPLSDLKMIKDTINRIDFKIDEKKISQLKLYEFYMVNASKDIQSIIK